MFDLNEITVTNITDLLTVTSQKGQLETMHNRKCYGLSFCREGQITYIHNGNKYISDPHHAIILPQAQSYYIQRDKSGIFAVINFECTNFLCDAPIPLPLDTPEPLMNDFSQMKKLFLFKQNKAKIFSLFYNIIHTLATATLSEGNILLPAVKYIENNYQSSALTNAVLAAQCNISEVYFRKLFIKHYGVTPHQYIIDLRLTTAKQLLSEGTAKINTVAEKCGFSGVYHFSRLFKERVGLTPTEYIKQNRISEF